MLEVSMRSKASRNVEQWAEAADGRVDATSLLKQANVDQGRNESAIVGCIPYLNAVQDTKQLLGGLKAVPAGMGEDRESPLRPNLGGNRDWVVAGIMVCDSKAEDMEIPATAELEPWDNDE